MEKLERCPICYGIIKIPGRKVEPGYGCQCRYGGSAHPEEIWEKRRQVVYSHMYMLSETQFNHVLWLQRELCESYSDSDPEKKKCLDELLRAYEERSRAVFDDTSILEEEEQMKAIEFRDDFEHHEANNDFTYPREILALRGFLEADRVEFNIDYMTLEKLWYAFSNTRCAQFLVVDSTTYNEFKEWVRDISAYDADRMNYEGEIMPDPYRPWDD